MRDERINYIAVGAFIIMIVTAFIFTISSLRGKSVSSDYYYTVFDNVGGIKPGAFVLFEGYKVGEVLEIDPLKKNNRTFFKIKISVKENWNIPKDSVVKVSKTGVLAALLLDIKSGDSEEYLKPGDTIRAGGGRGSITATAEKAGEFLDKMDYIVDDLKAISADLLIKTPQISSDIRETTRLMQDIALRLNTRVLSEPNIENVGQSIENIEKASENIVRLSADMSDMSDSIKELIDNNKDKLSNSSKDLEHTLQTIARHVDSIAYNLEGSSRNIHEFTRIIRENPSVLLRGTSAPSNEAIIK